MLSLDLTTLVSTNAQSIPVQEANRCEIHVTTVNLSSPNTRNLTEQEKLFGPSCETWRRLPQHKQ